MSERGKKKIMRYRMRKTKAAELWKNGKRADEITTRPRYKTAGPGERDG
jgi:hypothetical protein